MRRDHPTASSGLTSKIDKMPLFLAKKRTGSVPSGTLQRDTEYERGPASGFRYMPACKALTLESVLIKAFFACVSVTIWAYIISKKVIFGKRTQPSVYVPVPEEHLLPLQLPRIAVCFRQRYVMNISESTLLRKYNAFEPTRIFKGKKVYNVHFIDNLSSSDIEVVAALDRKTDRTYRASTDSITPDQLRYYGYLIAMVSGVVGTLWNTWVSSVDTSSSCIGTGSREIEVDEYTIDGCSPGDDDDPFDFVSTEKKTTFAQSTFGEILFTILPDKAHIQKKHFGNIQTFTETVGLTLPYNRDYSTPDSAGFMRFAEVFGSIMDISTHIDTMPSLPKFIKDMDDAWKTGILNTRVGEELAHIMMCCRIAYQVNASLYAVIEGGYSGCILGGGDYGLVVDGELYGPQHGVNFDLEKAHMNAHAVAIEKILDLLEIAKPRVTPHHMRHLREMAFAGGAPSGMIQNQISEHLDKLSFDEKPDSINSSNIKNMLDGFLSDGIIGKEVFLAKEAFWSTDPYVLSAARFGRRAPIIPSGQNLRKITSMARGDGVTKAIPAAPNGPQVLQFIGVPINAATRFWHQFMSQGMVRGEWDREVSGGITVTGPMKKDLWGYMMDRAKDGVLKDMGDVGRGGNKRGVEGESSEDEGQIPEQPEKKKKRSGLF